MPAKLFNKEYFTAYSTGSGSSAVFDNDILNLINNLGTNRAYAHFQFYNVDILDKITISFDVVGTGKIGVAFEEPSGSITSRSDFDLKDGIKQRIELKFTSTVDCFTSSTKKQITIGGLSNCVCNVAITNIKVEVTNNNTLSVKLPIKPVVNEKRLATIQKRSGVFVIHDGLTFSNATIVETNTSQLTLTFNEPINSVRGIAFVNCNYVYNSHKYVIATDSEDNRNISIKFFDLQGNQVLLADITENMIFSILFTN